MRVYLASDLGFTVPGRLFLTGTLAPAFAVRGWEVLDPWDADPEALAAFSLPPGPERVAALHRASQLIGARNRALLERADALFAVVDGPDVDSGTAAEIGWAAARGVPVVAWRSDSRFCEHEAAPVNIQVADFIEVSGGSFHSDLDAALAALGALAAMRHRGIGGG